MLKTKIFLVFSVCFSLLILVPTELQSAQNQQSASFDSIALRKLADGFVQPVGIVSTGIVGDTRLFVLEKNGIIQIYGGGEILNTPFLDLRQKVSTEQERGLMSLVFDPEFSQNGYFYIHYSEGGDSSNDTYGDTVVSRFEVSSDPNVADSSSEEIILETKQEFANHNGGEIFFDLNGNLLIGLGDGGGAGDPFDRAMDRSNLQGKMLRINVHGEGLESDLACGRVKNYKIPADNPRPNGENGWCPEILSAGLRNPWRSSLDPDTGKIFVGDVGENRFEEINIIPADPTLLFNYGWPCFEAWDIFKYPCDLDEDSIYRVPFKGYPRRDSDNNVIGFSVTGGYVYTGTAFPEWKGNYFYGDFISGKIFAVDKESVESNPDSLDLLDSGVRISSFGKGSDNELYVVDFLSGELFQLIGNHAIEINVVPPMTGSPDTEAVWQYKVTNIGVESIESVLIRQTIPADVTWVFGGTQENRVVELIVENIPAGETKTALWTGLLPDSTQALLVDKPEIDGGEVNYVIDDGAVTQLIVANLDESTFLPAVLR
ncbi:MAG: PQQ-dependent sugar dehydrogenase [Chloroflexota bacterium]